MTPLVGVTQSSRAVIGCSWLLCLTFLPLKKREKQTQQKHLSYEYFLSYKKNDSRNCKIFFPQMSLRVTFSLMTQPRCFIRCLVLSTFSLFRSLMEIRKRRKRSLAVWDMVRRAPPDHLLYPLSFLPASILLILDNHTPVSSQLPK